MAAEAQATTVFRSIGMNGTRIVVIGLVAEIGLLGALLAISCSTGPKTYAAYSVTGRGIISAEIQRVSELNHSMPTAKEELTVVKENAQKFGVLPFSIEYGERKNYGGKGFLYSYAVEDFASKKKVIVTAQF